MTPSHPYYYLALQAAVRASRVIMEIYNNGFETEFKKDGSPITTADRASNDLIFNLLSTTGFGFISEESPLEDPLTRQQHEYTWIVDPIDGTKEFTCRNGEFTVNIALVHKQQLVFGIVTAPAINQAWFGWIGHGAWKINKLNEMGMNNTIQSTHDIIAASQSIQPNLNSQNIVFAVSRSHLTETTKKMTSLLFGNFDQLNTIAIGSSIKFCMVAEGKADIYLRADPINEWDTAAGHAVLLAAGGSVVGWPHNSPILYNKDDLINPGFVAMGNNGLIPDLLAKFPS